jgi:hypothetical protein
VRRTLTLSILTTTPPSSSLFSFQGYVVDSPISSPTSSHQQSEISHQHLNPLNLNHPTLPNFSYQRLTNPQNNYPSQSNPQAFTPSPIIPSARLAARQISEPHPLHCTTTSLIQSSPCWLYLGSFLRLWDGWPVGQAVTADRLGRYWCTRWGNIGGCRVFCCVYRKYVLRPR